MTLTITPKADPDTSNLADAADQLREPLTGSLNARYLELGIRTRLELARHFGRSVIVAYTDLDDFRLFNDLWGQSTGDAALRAVTARLQDIRHNDASVDVARLGRDEYVVVAESHGDGSGSLDELGRAIVESLQAPIVINGQSHQLSISVGLTQSTPLSTPDSLLLEARLSLQNSNSHRDCAARIYDRTSGPNAEFVRALPAALQNGEIRCAFQPTIDVRSGEVVHVEALARWTRPSGEVVTPDKFVPCAESYGLASDLTRAVLNSVRDLVADPRTPEGLRVWVNVSASELDLDDFASRFVAMIDVAGVGAERIGIEVTETAAVRDPIRLASDIAYLQQHGVVVAIDDFGSGYSPLGYLRSLAPDYVKLDRSLISGIETDVVNQQLVLGIVNVLRELSIDVIAEGVERLEEQAWLQAHDVNNVQGYLWARPADPSTLDLTCRSVATSSIAC